MEIHISGSAMLSALVAKYYVSDARASLMILSFISEVSRCFFAIFRLTRLSGMTLSSSGLGLALKKLKLVDSKGTRMY
jgi:hypothetical protein